MVKPLKLFLYIFLILIFSLFFVRLFSERQIDDVSPEIPCEKVLLEKSDVLFVIPKFNNQPISENQEWCDYILSLNKTLGLHGVYHTYEEFLQTRNEIYLKEGIDIFEQCFHSTPERFKPPQLAISENNKELIKKEMKLDLKLNQTFHKVQHCNDTGTFPNWVVDFF